ncbi:murein hydrolase activator EnvC family protein [Pseudalkalibacillus decolorationis]|uniref:murein hydrolase activator EnvC family protein n=1 Tax=Pseudalkalibacillus decolorationis TaxID=163879 RepID=UPI002147DBE9|nr:M23 family metallopeptidase [Pseudalkalibacillus decolorationis]
MKKKIIVATASLSLLLGGVPGFTNGNGALANSLEDKINNVQEQRSENKSAQDKASSEIAEIQKDQDKLDAEIKNLDQKVADTSSKIDSKNKEIKKTKEEIDKLKEEIEVLVKRIAERDKLLKDRVKAMYENGGSVQYIEVVLGSQDFGDFLDRVFALNEIAEQDKKLLEAHKRDKKELEEVKKEVESTLDSLKEQMKELESLKAELDAAVKRKNALLGELKHEEAQMHKHIDKLENEEDLLAKQQAAFEAEKKRQEEEARKRAAEAAAAEAAARSNNNSSSSSNTSSNSSSGGGGGSTVSTPAVTGGMFMKPASGAFTSGMGQRWGSFHAGVDIARGGTVPIVAAASGTVIKSYYSSSYGNVVFIAHYLNGQAYTTVYAHMRERHIGTGASVQKGQQIGIMGSTGQSTGQHLHFEVHQPSWNSAKSNAINPRQFF